VEALARNGSLDLQHNEGWLGHAAHFALSLATGVPDAAPPYPPQRSPDPVVAMASIMVETALVLAGRGDEAVERVVHDPPVLEGPMADAMGMLAAVAFMVGGKADLAVPLLERAVAGAEVLRAEHLARAAGAMLADAEGRLPEVDAEGGGPSLADALVLRARVLGGDAEAKPRLRELAEVLVTPGLLDGLP
jgi:hypothetical protein